MVFFTTSEGLIISVDCLQLITPVKLESLSYTYRDIYMKEKDAITRCDLEGNKRIFDDFETALKATQSQPEIAAIYILSDGHIINTNQIAFCFWDEDNFALRMRGRKDDIAISQETAKELVTLIHQKTTTAYSSES